MSRANFASYPYVSPIHSYGENLGRAARSFLAALLAIDTAKLEPAQANATATGHDKAATARELNLLAREFDNIMPNQAAELRYLACRD